MKDKIREYIDFIFRNAPDTNETMELKEEISHDISMKYEKYLDEGLDENIAFAKSISNIGNVDELIDQLKSGNNLDIEKNEPTVDINSNNNLIKYLPILKAIAIAMIIVSFIPVILYEDSPVTVVIMITIVAIAVGILVFVSNYKKNLISEKTLASDFKDYRVYSKNYRKVKMIDSVISSVGLCIYLVLSFLTGRWDITWIIFIIIYMLKSVTKVIYYTNE